VIFFFRAPFGGPLPSSPLDPPLAHAKLCPLPPPYVAHEIPPPSLGGPPPPLVAPPPR